MRGLVECDLIYLCRNFVIVLKYVRFEVLTVIVIVIVSAAAADAAADDDDDSRLQRYGAVSLGK
jgi:hypothetical protein